VVPVVQCAVLVVGRRSVTFSVHGHGVSRMGRSMQRDIFTSDHEAFRGAVRSFIAKEVAL